VRVIAYRELIKFFRKKAQERRILEEYARRKQLQTEATAIGAAKRLTTGTAAGIDIWQTEDLSGNHPTPPSKTRGAKVLPTA